MFYWNIKKKWTFISSTFLTCSVFAQYNTFSPFSRYGIGDIQDHTLTYQKGMNNTGLALPIDTTAPLFINLSNPASLSYLRLTSIEADGNFYHTQIVNTQNYKVQRQSTNIHALVIGFPIKKHAGFCFGLIPYSFVGYQIQQNINTNNIGYINYLYEGSGGLNKVFAAYGFSIRHLFKKQNSVYNPFKEWIKNLSLGINAHYLFGEFAQTATVNYPSNTTYYNFVNDRRLRIQGISYEVGMHSYFLINKEKNNTLHIGFLFSNPSTLRVINDYIAYNFSYTYLGEKYIVDTVLYAENETGKMKLPVSYGWGMSYIVNNKWGISADVKYTNWSKFYLLHQNTFVKNNIEINMGGYFQPDRFGTERGHYADKIIYRAGLGYNSGYQEFQGKSVPLYSVALGVSLPLGLYKAFSAIHLSVQYSIKGQKNFILRENILKINIGMSLNDRWFIKYKYD